MLVYYYLPLGYASINGKQIHGVALGRPSTRVSHKQYLSYSDMLVQAPYTPEYIENKYNKLENKDNRGREYSFCL